jgi:hypothetical protein
MLLGVSRPSTVNSNSIIMKYKFKFYTQYSQFYLTDKTSSGNTDSISFWTEDAHNDRLAIEDGVLGVGTQCYGHVKGELDLLDSANNKIDFNQYDHIVESGIELRSGILEVLDCPNSKVQLETKVNPGTYRVRVYSSNLDSVIDDDGEDYYKIEIWPDTNIERKVLKRYLHK